jgi:hypothetical protein
MKLGFQDGAARPQPLRCRERRHAAALLAAAREQLAAIEADSKTAATACATGAGSPSGKDENGPVGS